MLYADTPLGGDGIAAAHGLAVLNKGQPHLLPKF